MKAFFNVESYAYWKKRRNVRSIRRKVQRYDLECMASDTIMIC